MYYNIIVIYNARIVIYNARNVIYYTRIVSYNACNLPTMCCLIIRLSSFLPRFYNGEMFAVQALDQAGVFNQVPVCALQS